MLVRRLLDMFFIDKKSFTIEIFIGNRFCHLVFYEVIYAITDEKTL